MSRRKTGAAASLPPLAVERIQTGVRLEKRLLKVLKALEADRRAERRR